MQNSPDTKRRKPADINQIAKSIVDLVTGDPIMEDPPVELKKRPLAIKRRDETEDGKGHVRNPTAQEHRGVA